MQRIKLFLTLSLLLFSKVCIAGDSVVLTSHTRTAADLRIERTNQGDKIVAVNIECTGSNTSAVTLFDSSGTILPHERFFEMVAGSVTVGTYDLYDRHISSGITYSIAGNPCVTIFWKDVSPGDGQ